MPVSWAVRAGDQRTVNVLDRWLDLKRRDGTLTRVYDYWILGKTSSEKHEPRWSVIRDVLGWVD